jgi:hypothetical protein
MEQEVSPVVGAISTARPSQAFSSRLMPIIRLRSVCILQTDIDAILMGPYRGDFGGKFSDDASGGISLMLLCSNSWLVYIYTSYRFVAWLAVG